MTTFDLIRHGAVDGPAALYGRTDVSLSQQGAIAIEATLKSIALPNKIISSPLQRCLLPAQSFAAQHHLPLQVIEAFQECHFGDWDGVAFDDMTVQWPSVERFFYQPAVQSPPNGESIDEFHYRVTEAWQQLIAANTAKHVVVLCHGGVIRQILADILGLDWHNDKWYRQLTIGYASLTRIQVGDHQDASAQVKCVGLTMDVLI